MSSDEKPSKRQPYTHLACSFCKDKHLKCDGKKPQCSTCLSKRLQCQYREERNRKRDSSSNKGQQKIERGLRDSISQLEQQIDQWKQKCLVLREYIVKHTGHIGFLDFPDFDGDEREMRLRQQIARGLPPNFGSNPAVGGMGRFPGYLPSGYPPNLRLYGNKVEDPVPMGIPGMPMGLPGFQPLFPITPALPNPLDSLDRVEFDQLAARNLGSMGAYGGNERKMFEMLKNSNDSLHKFNIKPDQYGLPLELISPTTPSIQPLQPSSPTDATAQNSGLQKPEVAIPLSNHPEPLVYGKIIENNNENPTNRESGSSHNQAMYSVMGEMSNNYF